MNLPTTHTFPDKTVLLKAPGGTATRLIVLLHGYGMDTRYLHRAAKAAMEAMPDADVLMPKLKTGLVSLHSCEEETRRAIDRVTMELRYHGKYRSIVLAGHSLGGIIVRKMYLAVTGQLQQPESQPKLNPEAPLRDEWRRWGAMVERLVLFAPVNRGWQTTSHISNKLLILLMWLGEMWSNLSSHVLRMTPLMYDVRRGAPFLTQLRLEWLKLTSPPLAVQLLGTKDDVVAPEDNIDLAGTGRNYYYLLTGESGHNDIMHMDGSAAGLGRKKNWLTALTGKAEDLDAVSLSHDDIRADMAGSDDALISSSSTPNKEVTDVAFVMHGIRDAGYWTHRIAHEIRAAGGSKWETVTSSYGYFAMGPFLFPWYRRRKVEWLADQYVRIRSLYPHARIHFVGHSNGTYLCADALSRYPGTKFENIAFAGSVVRRDYPWPALMSAGRVKSVINYVATADWVVAFFPAALEPVKFFDLGSAGHNGFKHSHPTALRNIRYAAGGHGAALEELNWKPIAGFITGTGTGDLPPALKKTRQHPVVSLLALAPQVVWLGIVVILSNLGGWILDGHAATGLGLGSTWGTPILFIGYLFGLWKVLTKF